MANEELRARIDGILDNAEARMRHHTLDKINKYVARRVAKGESAKAANEDANRRLQEYAEMLRD